MPFAVVSVSLVLLRLFTRSFMWQQYNFALNPPGVIACITARTLLKTPVFSSCCLLSEFTFFGAELLQRGKMLET